MKKLTIELNDEECKFLKELSVKMNKTEEEIIKRLLFWLKFVYGKEIGL